MKDEEGGTAINEDLGRSTARNETMKIVNMYGAVGDSDTDAADGVQADTQVTLEDKPVKTWVTLPKEYWPKHLFDIQDLGLPLNYALYGHTDAGT